MPNTAFYLCMDKPFDYEFQLEGLEKQNFYLEGDFDGQPLEPGIMTFIYIIFCPETRGTGKAQLVLIKDGIPVYRIVLSGRGIERN